MTSLPATSDLTSSQDLLMRYKLICPVCLPRRRVKDVIKRAEVNHMTRFFSYEDLEKHIKNDHPTWCLEPPYEDMMGYLQAQAPLVDMSESPPRLVENPFEYQNPDPQGGTGGFRLAKQPTDVSFDEEFARFERPSPAQPPRTSAGQLTKHTQLANPSRSHLNIPTAATSTFREGTRIPRIRRASNSTNSTNSNSVSHTYRRDSNPGNPFSDSYQMANSSDVSYSSRFRSQSRTESERSARESTGSIVTNSSNTSRLPLLDSYRQPQSSPGTQPAAVQARTSSNQHGKSGLFQRFKKKS